MEEIASKTNQFDTEGLKTGHWVYFNHYINYSLLSSRGNYEKGTKNGYWEYYWASGGLDKKGCYEKNLKVGHWEDYLPTGRLVKKMFYGRKFE